MNTNALRVLAICASLAWPVARAADVMDAAAESGRAVASAIASKDRPKADVFSAGGYYTELLSRTVGVKGQVIAYNNPPYAKFAEKGIAARYADGRLGNVRQITADIDQFDVAPGSLDAAIFIMSYHDLYWRPADGSWPPTDPAVLLKGLFSALKPGGVVVVEDHVAPANDDASAMVDKLHRIDPAIVKRDFEKAGFIFEAESKVLAHPDDDHTKPVFDDAIRGKTDQFVFRFRKPAL
jgi:predicted methyltransferase